MTSPGSPVTLVPGFQLTPVTSSDPQVVLLYTLQTTAPERIESVYMTLDYSTSKPVFQVFALQLRDPFGNVLYEQPTPDINGVDNAALIVVLEWSRLGNDSAQEAFFLHDDMTSGWARGWANMRLPDLVLAPNSTVVFLSWSDIETSAGFIQVDNCTVTTDRNVGQVSGTTAVTDILPILVPTTG